MESLTSNHGLTVTRTYEPNRDVLTQVQNQFGANTISQYDYTNDELAQRTSITTSGTAFDTSPDPVVEPGTTTYTTNELNQYTDLTLGSNPAISLTYDLDGNLIENNIHQFTYDAENRLISVTPITPTTGSTKVEFGYDYMSRRVQKQVSTYDGSSWVLEMEKSFTYDGWNLIREQTTVGTTSTDYYVWGLDLSGSLQGAGGIGGLLSKINTLTSQTFLYTFDANGNVGQLVDASNGTIAAHYEYTPFGNLVVSTGSESDSNVFRFSTKYYDAETELYYYGFRYYDPVLGRWRTRDPIGEIGGLNLYEFVRNNPINTFDPIGLKARFTIQNCVITVTLDITIYADKYVQVWFNQDVTRWDTLVARIRHSIQMYWNKRNWDGKDWVFNGCRVRFVASVRADTSSTTFWGVEGDNKIKITHVSGSKSSWVNGLTDSHGSWSRKEDDWHWVYAHEAGHLMKLDDHYHKVRDKDNKYNWWDEPDPGYEGLIMGQDKGSVSFKDIVNIMKKNNVECPCECRSFPWPKCN